MLKKVNIGCGQTPTAGWLNFDNSMSVRLAKYPIIVSLLDKAGLLGESSKNFIAFAKNSDILWTDATKHIPLPDNSVEVVYTSHMIEHFDREEVRLFLNEARRVLAPNGIIRIVVPDLSKLIHKYIVDGDAEAFMERSLLTSKRPKTLIEKLKYLLVGFRHHLWMYDSQSLLRLLLLQEFREPVILEAGSTTIPYPGDLDLSERADGSVYVEALK